MPKLSRRNLLRSAIGGGVLGAAGLVALPQLGHAANGLPLTVVNNSGQYGDDDVWVHVVGTNLSTGAMGHIGADGNFAEIAMSDNGSDGYTSYGIRLSEMSTLPLATLSGRVYVSMGEQLKFKVVSAGTGLGLQYPAGWTSGDPSYDILHDCFEFTNNDAGFYTNTTMVDMFSLPMYITLTGESTQTTGQWKDGARAKIFEEIGSQSGFEQLVIDDLRVIAPGHGLDAGLFSSSFLDDNIAARWSQYGSETMTMTANNQEYTGQVSGSNFVFSQNGSEVTSFSQPSTRDVLFCDGALTAPNDGVSGPIAAILAAGLNRGVLKYATQPVTDTSLYYPGSNVNHYARVMHEYTVDGKAYGFAFDDVCEQASYIQDSAPTAVTLTLQEF